MRSINTAARRFAKGFAWAAVSLLLLFGYGIGPRDARALREFCDGVARWQRGPDFRNVADEYVRLSHSAMNVTPWGVHATTIIMGLRSLPGLGPQYAATPSSRSHYDDFTRGELSAYLHLCGEQTMDWVIRDLHEVAMRGASSGDIEHFLRSWKMDQAVATDGVAIESVKRLLMEIDAAKPIDARMQIESELSSVSSRFAARMGYPSDRDRLTREQQHAIYSKLDADVREHDPELWRTKQISDLCSGIWAQTFGEDYAMVITPVLIARRIGMFAGPIGLVGMILVVRRRKAEENLNHEATKARRA